LLRFLIHKSGIEPTPNTSYRNKLPTSVIPRGLAAGQFICPPADFFGGFFNFARAFIRYRYCQEGQGDVKNVHEVLTLSAGQMIFLLSRQTRQRKKYPRNFNLARQTDDITFEDKNTTGERSNAP
jgi:hypothetical protein